MNSEPMPYWEVELDEPPNSGQLESWAKIRARGRRRYVAYSLLHFSLFFWLPGSLIVLLVIVWLFGIPFARLSYDFLVVVPLTHWVILRWRWRRNERRFLAAR